MIGVALSPLLRLVLQEVTPLARAVILGIAESEGLFVSSTELAASLGLKDRHALRRLLLEEGLPCYRQLAGWIRILIWLHRWEEDRMSLCRQASVTGHEPRSYYRTVQTVTGCTWREIQTRGALWTALTLLEQCRARPHTMRSPFARVS
jgi:hypothetical protein